MSLQCLSDQKYVAILLCCKLKLMNFMLQKFGEQLGILHSTVERKLANKITLVGKFVAQCQVDINTLLDDIMKTHELVMVITICIKVCEVCNQR